MNSRALLVSLLAEAIPFVCSAKDNSLKKGETALQFEIGDRLDISSFQGTTISIKKHHSDKTAFRLGLTTDIDLSSSDETSTNDDTTKYNYHYNTTSVKLSAVIQRIHYPHPHASANFFWGLGPRVDLDYSNDKQKITQVGDGQVQSRNYESAI
jgi:hypothetical protein